MSVLEDKVKPMISDIEKAIEANSNYCALSLALALPDIISSLEKPKMRGRQRYIEWCENYFLDLHEYSPKDMTGGDIYALRCAYLHNGEDDLSKQCVDHSLARFRFIYSVNGSFIHRNRTINGDIHVLQLDLHEFCREMIDSVINFLYLYKDDDNVNELSKKLITVESYEFGFFM